MSWRITLLPAATAAAAMLLILSPTIHAAPRASTVERYVATAINMGVPGRTGVGTVQMDIEKWSTDADHDRLKTVLIEQGPNKLLETLQKMPRVGFIRTPNSIGYDLHYARRTPTADGGERVVMMTDRYIGFWEAKNRPRTIDYPFTLIEMHIGPDGRGEGKLSLATKITVDKASNEVVLENYASQPVQLTEVRRESNDTK
ncbi:MAG TPA: hypothetical protein VH436_12100 [Vicinamibacterales bacterium]